MNKLSPTIRKVGPADYPFLELMLFEAFFWRSGEARPRLEEFRAADEEFRMLLEEWGRAGDTGFVAEIAGQPVGAAWYRFYTEERHSYGFIGEEVPEIAIGVDGAHRGRGVGRMLLEALIEEAQRQGLEAVSLSVEIGNPAMRLYESLGFRKVRRTENEWSMVLELGR